MGRGHRGCRQVHRPVGRLEAEVRQPVTNGAMVLIVQVSEADNSLPLDIHNQVFQLVEKGNQAFIASRFEEVN